jgi:CheY-like chemotaxis protein
MSILIVEDNSINAKLLEIALKAKGYQTLLAANGVEALTALSAHDDVSLIITDYMMPEMNGLEFIAKVKQQPACKDIPILVASAYSDLETVRHAIKLGCAGFLVKPIVKTQLIERVAHLLKAAPVVLRDKNQVMNKLEIGPGEYDDLVRMFAAQLADVLPMVALAQGDADEADEAILQSLLPQLKELAESAELLGGEDFARLYSTYRESGRLTGTECHAILRALQELEIALAAIVRPLSNSGPAT